MKSRKILWIGLGLLWTVDGLLQAQPAMFTQRFVSEVLRPAAEGEPTWVAAMIHAGIGIWQHNMVLSNVLAVLIQLAIGLLVLAGWGRYWGRVGLWLSIGWSLVVWGFAEGLGGLFTGSATLLNGAPGAALIYAVGAGLLLLPARWWTSGSVSRWTMRGSGVFWLVAAVGQAIPAAGYFSGTDLSGVFQDAASLPQPRPLSSPIEHLVGVAASHPVVCNAIFIAVMAGLGIALLRKIDVRWVYGVAALWLLFVWWMGQDFGAVLSGIGTDPNLALPLGLVTLVPLLPGAPVPLGAPTARTSERLSESGGRPLNPDGGAKRTS